MTTVLRAVGYLCWEGAAAVRELPGNLMLGTAEVCHQIGGVIVKELQRPHGVVRTASSVAVCAGMIFAGQYLMRRTPLCDKDRRHMPNHFTFPAIRKRALEEKIYGTTLCLAGAIATAHLVHSLWSS